MTGEEIRRVPVGEALPGVEMYPLPEGEKVVAALALVKTRDENGEIGWYTRATHDYNRLEFLGALISYGDNVRRAESAGWADDDDDAPQAHGDIDT